MKKEAQYFLDRRYTAVLALLVVLGLVGGYVAYVTYTQTETVTEQRVASTATTSTDFQHGVTVQRDTIVFEEGIYLGGRTLYFSSLSPELNATYSVRHGGDDPEPADARAELMLVLRSVGDDGTEHWRVSDTLATAEEASLEPGEPLEANFKVNVTNATARIDRIQSDLGASPGETQVLVTSETVIAGEVGDEEFNETRSESLRINPGSGTYSVSVDVEGQNSHQALETVETEVEPSALSQYGSVALVFVSLVGILGMLIGRRMDVFELPQKEIERMEFESQRESLDEWISRGTLSGDEAETVMRLESLEDLVDVAIDSNRRVTELDDGSYVVLVDGVRYVYEPDSAKDDAGRVRQTGDDETET